MLSQYWTSILYPPRFISTIWENGCLPIKYVDLQSNNESGIINICIITFLINVQKWYWIKVKNITTSAHLKCLRYPVVCLQVHYTTFTVCEYFKSSLLREWSCLYVQHVTLRNSCIHNILFQVEQLSLNASLKYFNLKFRQ